MALYSVDIGCLSEIAFVFETPTPRCCQDQKQSTKEFAYQTDIHRKSRVDKMVLVCVHQNAPAHLVKYSAAEAKWPADSDLLVMWTTAVVAYVRDLAMSGQFVTNDNNVNESFERVKDSTNKLRQYALLCPNIKITKQVL